MLFKLAIKSLLQRRVSVLLTVMMIAVSVFVLLSVDTLRHQVKHSFSHSVSGVDLIIGARTGQLNLLLYSVFHIGNATNNITWQTYQDIKSNHNIAWTVPISLGDSHKGYRVVGTSLDLFTHFKYGKQQALQLAEGHAFSDVYDVVLGADVAKKLGYKIGDKIVLAHGIARNNFSKHDDKPFIISGIFEPTATPVDKTLFVSLQAIEAIHKNWKHGVKITDSTKHDDINELKPTQITAFMLGLKTKLATFEMQRIINIYQQEALTGVLPATTLVELWQILGNVEQVLLLISALVLAGALLGMSNMLLVSMRERQYELAILRIVGASPWVIMLLIQLEAILLVIAGMVIASVTLWLTMTFMSDYLSYEYGVFLTVDLFSSQMLIDLAWILLASFVVTLLPALNAYRKSLHASL